jgi:hypothetical protein
LIENFISRMNVDIKYEISDDIEKNWDRYIKEERDIELTKITANKSLGLNEKETKKYMAKCFDRGEIIEHGSEITDIFKKPRPWNSGNEEKKKAIEELTNFFEKYYDISNSKII